MDKFQVDVKGQVFEFIQHEITKGTAQGQKYWKPADQFSTEEEATAYLNKLTSAYGSKLVIANFVAPRMATYSNMLTKEATDEAAGVAGKKDEKGKPVKINKSYVIEDEEKFNEAFVESYSKMFTNMDARGESTKELTERINNLLAQLSTETDDVKIMDIVKQLRQTKIALEAKKHKDEDDEEDKNGEAVKVEAAAPVTA